VTLFCVELVFLTGACILDKLYVNHIWLFVLLTGLATHFLYGTAQLFLISPRKSKRIYAQSQRLSRNATISWDEENLNYQDEGGSSQTNWKSFIKWVEGKEYLLLYTYDTSFFTIPKKLFADADQLKNIEDFLKKSGIAHIVRC
jgi:hypothetical protein